MSTMPLANALRLLHIREGCGPEEVKAAHKRRSAELARAWKEADVSAQEAFRRRAAELESAFIAALRDANLRHSAAQAARSRPQGGDRPVKFFQTKIWPEFARLPSMLLYIGAVTLVGLLLGAITEFKYTHIFHYRVLSGMMVGVGMTFALAPLVRVLRVAYTGVVVVGALFAASAWFLGLHWQSYQRFQDEMRSLQRKSTMDTVKSFIAGDIDIAEIRRKFSADPTADLIKAMTESIGFYDFLKVEIETGYTVKRRGSTRTVDGVSVLLDWAIETFFVGLGAFALPRKFATRPYSYRANHWFRLAGTLAATGPDVDRFFELARSGHYLESFSFLVILTPRVGLPRTRVEFYEAGDFAEACMEIRNEYQTQDKHGNFSVAEDPQGTHVLPQDAVEHLRSRLA